MHSTAAATPSAAAASVVASSGQSAPTSSSSSSVGMQQQQQPQQHLPSCSLANADNRGNGSTTAAAAAANGGSGGGNGSDQYTLPHYPSQHSYPGGYPYGSQQHQQQQQQQQQQQPREGSNVYAVDATNGGHNKAPGHPGRGGGAAGRGGMHRGGGSNHFNNWDQNKLYRNMSLYNTNPVGALQERFQSRGIAPEYRVELQDGASHCPTFTCQVFVTDLVAGGSGSSKKQAKHCAARAMLDKLDGRVPADANIMAMGPGDGGAAMVMAQPPPAALAMPPPPAAIPPPVEGAVDAATTSSSSGGVGVMANTIGKLQETCVHRGLPMPIYNMTETQGAPHKRSFRISVHVGRSLEASGEGTSKKDAKRDAAAKVLMMIDAVYAAEDAAAAEAGVEKGESAAAAAFSAEDEELAKKIANMKIDTMASKDTESLKQFLQRMKLGGSKLFMLHRTNLKGGANVNLVELLKELAAEQKFEVTFVEAEEMSADGEVWVMVQLTSLPLAVVMGHGKDKAAAEENAARNALYYIKVMTNGTT